MRKFLIPLIILLIVTLLGVGGYFLVTKVFNKKTTLTVWTLTGTETGLKSIADIFAAQHPDVTVNIVPINEQSYEFKFLYSLASQKTINKVTPPDVVVLPNEMYALHRNKLVAAPVGVLDSAIQGYKATPVPSATPQPEVVKGRTNDDIIKQDYGPIAAQDLITDTNVWGVPLNSDTLALYYNKGLITQPPKTWNELVDMTKRLTQKNGATINRSVAALGSDTTVAYDLDILSILMLQNGTTMVRENEKLAAYNLTLPNGTNPGASSLDFYTSFARANKETYTWNNSFGSSLAALKSGKTLMAFGYQSDAASLNAANIGVAPLPQVDVNNPKTYGRYLGLSVTKQAADPEVAWQFASLAANPDVAETYAKTTASIPGRVDVGKRMALDAKSKVFQAQTAQAVNWQKKEISTADAGLNDALSLVLKSDRSAATALDVSAKAYTTFLQADPGFAPDPKMITLWQSTDDVTNYRIVAETFIAENKDIGRVYQSKRDATRLEWEVLNAAAARLGPDVVAVPGDRVARLHWMLLGFPEASFNPLASQASDIEALQKLYIPAVSDDNLVGGVLYGMPASVETLQLAYNVDQIRAIDREKSEAQDQDYSNNIDLFSDGPTTWGDLETMIKVSTSRSGNAISRSALALGTGSNVVHAGDIYAAFVKQAGGDINDPDRLRSGIQLPISSSDPNVPGQEALDFIHQFSNPGSQFYTWNKDQPNSLEALADGKVMMAFLYPRDVAKIKARNPQINLNFFPLPQIDTVSTPVDLASSFSLVIPRGSTKPESALKFIQTANGQANESGFIAPVMTDNKPPTLDRSGSLGIQRFQANTAEGYQKGNFPEEVDQTLIDLLDKKINVDQAGARLNQSFAKPIITQ